MIVIQQPGFVMLGIEMWLKWVRHLVAKLFIFKLESLLRNVAHCNKEDLNCLESLDPRLT